MDQLLSTQTNISSNKSAEEIAWYARFYINDELYKGKIIYSTTVFLLVHCDRRQPYRMAIACRGAFVITRSSFKASCRASRKKLPF